MVEGKVTKVTSPLGVGTTLVLDFVLKGAALTAAEDPGFGWRSAAMKHYFMRASAPGVLKLCFSAARLGRDQFRQVALLFSSPAIPPIYLWHLRSRSACRIGQRQRGYGPA